MEIKKGIGVSPGVVVSTAIVLDDEDLLIPKRQIDVAQVLSEIERFHQAIAKSVADLSAQREEITEKYGKEIGGIFSVHLGLLSDKTNVGQIVAGGRDRHSTAAY